MRGLTLLTIKENYLKMNNEEINKICDWMDKNITRYIGWNEWGSLRIVNPNNFKRDLKSIFEEKEPSFEELDGIYP